MVYYFLFMTLKNVLKLVSPAFALLFTEISVVWVTEISVKSSEKADETSLNPCLDTPNNLKFMLKIL